MVDDQWCFVKGSDLPSHSRGSHESSINHRSWAMVIAWHCLPSNISFHDIWDTWGCLESAKSTASSSIIIHNLTIINHALTIINHAQSTASASLISTASHPDGDARGLEIFELLGRGTAPFAVSATGATPWAMVAMVEMVNGRGESWVIWVRYWPLVMFGGLLVCIHVVHAWPWFRAFRASTMVFHSWEPAGIWHQGIPWDSIGAFHWCHQREGITNGHFCLYTYTGWYEWIALT